MSLSPNLNPNPDLSANPDTNPTVHANLAPSPRQAPMLVPGPAQLSNGNGARPKIMISLRRSSGSDWAPSQHAVRNESLSIPAQDVGLAKDVVVSTVAASVADNVSSFLSGIRATFRQDNVYVTQQKSHDGKRN